VRGGNYAGVVLVAAILAAGLVGMSGCSESRKTRASRELLGKVSLADKRYARALALLANPVYKVAGESVPAGSGAAGQAEIEVAPVGQLHPEVMDLLGQIEQDLTAALADADKADASDVALARMTLASAHALKGYCQMILAGEARQRLNATRSKAEDVLAAVTVKAGLVDYYQALASLGDEDLSAARRQAIAEQAAVEDHIKDIDERLAAMAEDKKTQAGTFQEKNAVARAMSIEAGTGSAKEGMEKLQKALVLKALANKAESAMAEIERETAVLDSRRTALQVDLAGTQAKIAAADQEIVARRDLAASNKAGVSAAQVALKAEQDELGELVAAMAQACDELAAAQARASDAYDLALSQLKQAAPAEPAVADVRRADVLMSSADVKAQSLASMQANASFLDGLRRYLANAGADSGIAAVAGKLASFVAKPEVAKDSAAKQYQEAADLYKKALSRADRDHRWAYQGQLAAAYAGLYQLNGDAQSLQAARETLAEALKGNEFSPYLAPLAEIQKALAKGG